MDGKKTALVLSGGGTFASATYGFIDASSGTIGVDGNATITYTGLEPVSSIITATDVTLNYSTTAETLTITDAGVWTYTLDQALADELNQGESFDETFTVRVTDTLGAYDEATVTVTVVGSSGAVPAVSLATTSITTGVSCWVEALSLTAVGGCGAITETVTVAVAHSPPRSHTW